MKLAKNRPKTSTVDVLRREMDQFFDDLVPFSWTRDNGGKLMESWAPSADISEDKKEYLLRMDIPGMEKNDIKVNFQDGRITITGERNKEETEEDKNFIRKERYEGSFYRSFSLPEAVKEDEIHASFKNGVLKISIPKAEVVEPKAIKVS